MTVTRVGTVRSVTGLLLALAVPELCRSSGFLAVSGGVVARIWSFVVARPWRS